MKIKYYLLLAVVVLGSAFTLTGMSVAPVKALEEPTELTNVSARIYPEYDDPLNLNSPSLLVILQGEVGGVTLPATIRFLVPSTAFIYSASSLDENGQYIVPPGAPDRNASEDLVGWDEVNFDITTSTFIVEYYDPVIGNQPDKSIDYEFHPLYPITDLDIVIQEPLTSSNYSILPAADYTFSSVDNFSGKQFKFHRYNRTDLAAGDVLRYNITYTKTDLRPSISNGATGSSGTGTGVLTVVGIVLGTLVLAAIGIYFALRIKSNRRNLKRFDRRAMTGVSKKERLQDRFCGKCRQPLESSDVFCPNCGARRN